MDLIFPACFVVFLFGISSAKLSGLEREPASTFESNLLTLLLANYSKYTRPAVSNIKPVTVNFDVKLGKLVQLDIKQQVMISNTRIMMRWYDPNLKWNRNVFNGTDFINIPNQLIWTPDIMLQNTAVRESKSKTDVYKAHVRVRSNGEVMWMSPVTVQASCAINLKWFPFDQQTCELTFGSISYTKSKLQIDYFKKNRATADMKAKFYYSSGQWDMIKMTQETRDVTFECCKDPFSMLKYTFEWKRLTTYWLLYLVMPCSCLSFLAVFTFFIPAGTGERTGFAITTVLAMSVYLLVISDRMPEKSDEAPLIGVLYIVLFFLMTAVLVSVIVTTSMAYKITKPPEYLRRFLKTHQKNKVQTSVLPLKPIGSHNEAVDIEASNVELQEARFRRISRRSRNLRRTMSTLSYEEEIEMGNQEEWGIIASHIDNILFWVFMTLTVVGPVIVIICYFV